MPLLTPSQWNLNPSPTNLRLYTADNVANVSECASLVNICPLGGKSAHTLNTRKVCFRHTLVFWCATCEYNYKMRIFYLTRDKMCQSWDQQQFAVMDKKILALVSAFFWLKTAKNSMTNQSERTERSSNYTKQEIFKLLQLSQTSHFFVYRLN